MTRLNISESELRNTTQAVARRLDHMSLIGRNPGGGWTRSGFSLPERQAHDLFIQWATELSLEISQDQVGSTYARLPGNEPTLMVGSHLDTVPQGGMFDGVAGIIAGIEAVRLLRADGLSNALTVVAFASEEGHRFGTPSIGARIATGSLQMTDLEQIRDSDGVSVRQALDLLGSTITNNAQVWKRDSVACYLELHVEQGRVLEEVGRKIGIVNTIAGSTRMLVSLRGRSDHSGATPMHLRHDALVGAAEVICFVERAARLSPTAVATVGKVTARPNTMTTIADQVHLTIDVRDIDSVRQQAVANAILAELNRIAMNRGLHKTAEVIHDQVPFALHPWVLERLAATADAACVPYHIMPSGAGHDAGYVSAYAPTGMLFVPSVDGRSHAPEEWSNPEDVALGTIILARALRAIDAYVATDKG